MKTFIHKVILALILILSANTCAFAHCQIPCGIYGDEIRFSLMREDTATIEKSISEIKRLSGKENIDYNQLIRWVTNRDEHADRLMDTISDYFLAQRIIIPKQGASGKENELYVEKVTVLHHILVTAMKSKQSLDLKNVDELKNLIDRFEKLYFPENHKH